MKRYFSKEGYYFVYELKVFIENHKDDNEVVILYEEKRETGGEMWCDKYGEFVVSSFDCGCICGLYSPCNGVSGRCRHLKNGFIQTGRKYKLLNGKLTLMEDKNE